MHIATPETLAAAAEYLSTHDPHLRPVITAVGPCSLRHHTEYYRALSDSIIGQQLSVKAAASIKRRFRDLFGGVFPTPAMILDKSVEELRSAGLSRAKATYIQDLARHISEDKIAFAAFDEMTNVQIIKTLTDVKGIGEWTAHMFLMFCMGRLDVLPVGDLGVRTGIRNLYGFEALPSPQEITNLAHTYRWHPYESVASWYIWQFLDNEPAA